MLTIIEIAARADGGHGLEQQSHRTENWMGDGWIAVPEALEETAWSCAGYCDLTIEDGALTGITPTERPPEPEAPESLTPEELTSILKVMNGGEADV